MHPRAGLSRRILNIRLLTTASAAALAGIAGAPVAAHADPNAGFHLWVDLTAQYTMTSGQKTNYAEPFDDRSHGFYPLVGVRGPEGGDGTLGLLLQKDDWFYNLSYNYGRTGVSRGDFYAKYTTPGTIGTFRSRADGLVRHSESHKMLDFTVGQDVGLGMFGMDGTSILSAGVRWANFEGTTIGDFSYRYSKYNAGPFNFVDTYNFSRELHRTFNGIGPVITWRGSTPFADPEFSFEWGANAAILFGHHSVHGINSPYWTRGASVTQAGGYLGFGWHCQDWPVTVTAGYNVQSSWNVLPRNYDLDDGHHGADRLAHGPFIRLTTEVE